MIVCFCHPTTDKDVARYRANGIRNLKDLSQLTGAGRRCTACRHELARLLRDGVFDAQDRDRSIDLPGRSVQHTLAKGAYLR